MKTHRLSGTVVSSEDAVFFEAMGVDYISASLVDKYLKDAEGEDITFNLNSGGGSVTAGSEIYTMLREYSGKVIINITGLSASIASIFMMGADEINMSHQATIMIHKPSVMISGSVDSDETGRVANMLKSTEKALVKVYTKRTNLSEEKITEMMFNETWLTSDEALELGFVDNVFEDSSYSKDTEALVAMVQTSNKQIQLLEELNNMKENTMDKTFLDRVKSIINGGVEQPEEVVEVTEEVTEAVEVATEDVVEEVKKEVVETGNNTEEVAEEPTEEVVDDVDTTELLEKAVNTIEQMAQENEQLRVKVAELEEANAKLSNEKEELTAKTTKSQDVVNRLNELLNSEEANVVAVQQTQEIKNKGTMPTGYKGIRGGLN